MNRLLDEKLKTNFQTKHIIKLQSLLTEYDRQNRFLNQQVRELLQENKSLKIDKLKTSVVQGHSRRRDSQYRVGSMHKGKQDKGAVNAEDRLVTEIDHLHKSREKLPPRNLYENKSVNVSPSIDKSSHQKRKQNVKRDVYLVQDSNVQAFSFGELSNSKESTPRIPGAQQKVARPISIITQSPQKAINSMKKQPGTTAAKEEEKSPIIQRLKEYPPPRMVSQQVKPVMVRRTYTLQAEPTQTYSISILPKETKLLPEPIPQSKPNMKASSIEKRKKFISIVSSKGSSSVPKQN